MSANNLEDVNRDKWFKAKKWTEKSLRLHSSEKGFQLLGLINSKVQNGFSGKASPKEEPKNQ